MLTLEPNSKYDATTPFAPIPEPLETTLPDVFPLIAGKVIAKRTRLPATAACRHLLALGHTGRLYVYETGEEQPILNIVQGCEANGQRAGDHGAEGDALRPTVLELVAPLARTVHCAVSALLEPD
jgi:hypothetical protein